MSFDIARYFTAVDGGIYFTQIQANHFAKGVAGDFNPIHDIGAKRFCVPGDLLFAAMLSRYGVYENLKVDLMSLMSADVVVELPDELAAKNDILDVSGNATDNADFVSSLVQQYVQFSGRTFPDILVKLMRENNTMINPARPLVIYKDMSLQIDALAGENLTLELDKATLDADGKKGKTCLQFIIKSGADVIGRGEKNMLLSGLREFDEAAMSEVVAQYTAWKSEYTAVVPE